MPRRMTTRPQPGAPAVPEMRSDVKFGLIEIRAVCCRLAALSRLVARNFHKTSRQTLDAVRCRAYRGRLHAVRADESLRLSPRHCARPSALVGVHLSPPPPAS